MNPSAVIIRGASPITLDDPDAVSHCRVLVVEDGPTTTHGGMSYGAGYVAATQGLAAEIVDPRPFAVPVIGEVYQHYPHIGAVLHAMSYFTEQLGAL